MKNFRPTEIFFLVFGLILMVGAMTCIHFNLTLTKFLNLSTEPGDPFQASYSAPPPLPEKEMPKVVAAVSPEVEKPPKPAIFLVFPSNQAILTKAGNEKKGYSIKFKFDVFPKNTPCTFELLYQNEVVIAKSFPGSPTGNFKIPILIRKAGLYQWRVKAGEITGELRTVTIHNE